MKEFFHVIRNSTFSKIMLHNTYLREGYIYSEQMQQLPSGGIASPYNHFNTESEKENLWE